jgi:hypothetical protein
MVPSQAFFYSDQHRLTHLRAASLPSADSTAMRAKLRQSFLMVEARQRRLWTMLSHRQENHEASVCIPGLVLRDACFSSWPGLSRPSTSFLLSWSKDVDPRHKAGHDEAKAPDFIRRFLSQALRMRR